MWRLGSASVWLWCKTPPLLAAILCISILHCTQQHVNTHKHMDMLVLTYCKAAKATRLVSSSCATAQPQKYLSPQDCLKLVTKIETTTINHQLLSQTLMALDNGHNSTIYDLLLQTLWSWDTVNSHHWNSLIMRIPDILNILPKQSNRELEVCASRVATATYCSDIQSLIQPSSGPHFQGSTACLAQL
jgi:hypothetical protein